MRRDEADELWPWHCECGGLFSDVTDSRPSPIQNPNTGASGTNRLHARSYIRRRRKCNKCGQRVTTVEVKSDELGLAVDVQAQARLRSAFMALALQVMDDHEAVAIADILTPLTWGPDD